MNDDEVLNAVKNTLSAVQMDRPIEAIQQRGQAHRRNRRLFGVVAGGGLAAVAAVALGVPMANHQSHPAPVAGGGTTEATTGATTGATTAMQPAAFTVTKLSDGSVKLTLDYKKILDPDALQKALAGAGIPAVVKAGVLCSPTGKELPQADQVFRVNQVNWPDGSAKEYDLVITPSKMPDNSRVYFSVFAVHPGQGYAKAAQYLVSTDDPMSCRPIG